MQQREVLNCAFPPIVIKGIQPSACMGANSLTAQHSLISACTYETKLGAIYKNCSFNSLSWVADRKIRAQFALRFGLLSSTLIHFVDAAALGDTSDKLFSSW